MAAYVAVCMAVPMAVSVAASMAALTYDDVIWSLQQPGVRQLVKSRGVISSQGELGASSYAYAAAVADFMNSAEPEERVYGLVFRV